MRKPFTVFDPNEKSYFWNQAIIKGKREFIFGGKNKAARYGSSALAQIIAKEVSLNTGRSLEIRKTENAQEKRAAKHNNKMGVK